MLSCRDVAHLIGSDGVEHASVFRRLLVRFHLFRCEPCRRHAAELATIAEVSRDTWKAASAEAETMRRLEGAILDQASRGSDEQQGKVAGNTPD